MEINLKLTDINEALPFEEYPEKDRKFLFGQFLIWGIWDPDESRAYMQAIAVQYVGDLKEFKHIDGRPLSNPQYIQYWSPMPDFYPNKDMTVTEARAKLKNIIYQCPERTPKSVQKVVDYLKIHECLDQEELKYDEESKISMEELQETFNFLDHRNNKCFSDTKTMLCITKFFQLSKF